MDIIKPGQLEDAIIRETPILWELLSKLLLDSKQERNKLRSGEHISPAAVMVMLKHRLDDLCAPHLVEYEEDDDEDDEDDDDVAEDDGVDGNNAGKNVNKKRNGNPNSSGSKKAKFSEAVSEEDELESDEDEEPIDVDDDDSSSADFFDEALMPQHLLNYRQSVLDMQGEPVDVCDLSPEKLRRAFDPADYFEEAPSHPLADDEQDDEQVSSSSRKQKNKQLGWADLSIQNRIAVIKALTDFRLATEEFRSFVRTLETVESLRIQPFAVDGEQRAYYDFGFKDGRIYSEPLPQKRSVFVQFRHSAARIMLEHPSVNELDVQRRELKELMFDNEDDEDSDSESNVDDLEAKREALSNLTKVPSSATAASATRKAQENLRELWFPASASSQTFTLVSENLDSLQKLVQKQKALLSEVGKKGQQLTKELLSSLEARLQVALAEVEQQRKAEEARQKRLAMAAMPRKRSERLQILELERARQEEEEQARLIIKQQRRKEYLQALSDFYAQHY